MNRLRLTTALSLIVFSLVGCVERKFVIDSNPRGAKVYVNNVEIGPTPADVAFQYYGTYNITLEMQGYQTETFQERIAPPWYAYPPIDFAAEHLVTKKLRDIRRLNFDLKPTVQLAPNDLLREALELRERGQSLPQPRNVENETNLPETPRR